MIKFGSVCSGIEAASVAWEPLGWSAEWLSEFDKFPSAVLAHHWPEVTNLGDMTTIAEKIKSGEVSAPEVFVGGTPCQSFSVAGLRKGLSDDRGNLTLEFVRIANEIDKQRKSNGLGQSVIAWENVPGVLSSKDNAFGAFLAGLAGETVPLQPPGKRWANAGYVLGPQRAIAWRVLDAQYFGLAQRRKRVFVVASARAGFDPAAVLFESQVQRRDIEPWEEYWSSVDTRSVKACAFDMLGFGQYGIGQTASTCKARDYKDATDLVFSIHENSRSEMRISAVGYQLNCGGGKPGQGYSAALIGSAVRRLTPTECARLQGFPDDHCKIPWRKKSSADCPDGPQYKAYGNSMAVNVMRWIGERIDLEIKKARQGGRANQHG